MNKLDETAKKFLDYIEPSKERYAEDYEIVLALFDILKLDLEFTHEDGEPFSDDGLVKSLEIVLRFYLHHGHHDYFAEITKQMRNDVGYNEHFYGKTS
jgi:hypothetical protein